MVSSVSGIYTQMINGTYTNRTSVKNGNEENANGTGAAYNQGNVYTGMSLEELMAEVDALGAKVGAGEKPATGTKELKTEEAKKEQARIEELSKEKEANEKKMAKIEKQMKTLAEEAAEEIKEALKQQNKIAEEHEDAVKEAINEQLAAYIAANKEGGEGMTKDELNANIENALPDFPGLGKSIALLASANEKVAELDDCLDELKTLIDANKVIETQIGAGQQRIEAVEKAAEEAEKKKCCDPIGFTTGEGENAAKYDFIVDDGAFDSTSDFLGADNQWAAMAALDTTGDGIVDANELAAGNIKAVKTDANGNQSVVDLAAEFGENFFVDLNSYAKGGSHEAVSAGDHDNDGVADQTLLGTFNVNINGQEVSGYNTLDDVDWLSANYGVASDVQAVDVEAAANNEDMSGFSQELQLHQNIYDMYSEISAELKEEIAEGYKGLKLSEENVASLDATSKSKASVNAQNFFETLEEKEEEEKVEDTQAA